MNKKPPLTDKQSLILQNPLGSILVNAGLISPYQLQVALMDQQRLAQIQEPHVKLGEILGLRGWIRPKTADFFVIDFPNLLTSPKKHTLSFYLLEAGLLEPEEVRIILNEQKRVPLKFGLIAIKKGWVKSKTIDFFLEYFQPSESRPLSSKRTEKLVLAFIPNLIRLGTSRSPLLKNKYC